MRILFVGGTGLISSASCDRVLELGHELFLLNRGQSTKYPPPAAAKLLQGDVRSAPDEIPRLLVGLHFDAVVDFIAFSEADIQRDLEWFRDRTNQFVFISSASAYQKPPQSYLITESTPLENPFWSYSQGKIAAERRLAEAQKTEHFPATIVRPSLTYGPAQIPFCVGSWEHPWTVIDRMLRGRPVIVPGDGSSLWVLTWNAEFARGLVGLLGNPNAIGEAYHITSDEVLTWDQIYRTAFEVLGLTPNIVHVPSELIAAYWPHARGSLIGDKMNSVVFDNHKIKQAVPDFVCSVKWKEGLGRALEWHRAHPQFQTIDGSTDDVMEEILAAYERAWPGGTRSGALTEA